MTDADTGLADGPTFPAAPPERTDLPGGVALLRCDPERAAAAVEAINESLDHLRPWMAWAAQPATEASIGTFFATSMQLWDRRRDFGYSLVEVDSGRVVGGAGLHGRLDRHGLEIGYWVHVDWIGRGLATEASRVLTDAAFAIPGVERVRIQCEVGNVRSARVPERLGYRFHGVREPEDGPCAGRPTQVWLVERADWVSEAPAARP